MKRLLLGNIAAAQGLWQAGCDFISSYPGTPSTEITEAAAKLPEIYCEWAPNEKVALESAFGASLAGHRAAVAQKHVGLNVAADPLFTSAYTGVNAGLVIFVADDPGLHSSQNEQDSRNYARAAKIPMLEPANSQEILDFTTAAFDLSERFDTPILIRLNTRVAHSQSPVQLTDRGSFVKAYHKDISKYVMVPAFAKARHPILEQRLADFKAFAESSSLNHVEFNDSDLGFIASSSAFLYLKELFPDASFLKLGVVFPFPDDLIRSFASSVKRLIVAEELDPFIEEHVKALGLLCEGKSLFPTCGEFSPNLLAQKLGKPTPPFVSLDEAIPPRPPVMCAGCPHRGLFFALKKNKATVLGDIGCYTLGAMPPLSTIDSTLCMGASIGMAHGFHKAANLNPVAVIGDSTFIHSGITALANVAYNQSNATVIILDNSITGMTGHQQNPATGLNIKGEPAGKVDLESLCRALGINRVRVVDPYNLSQCQDAIRDELAANAPSVIISRRPCALLKHVKHKSPLKVDPDKCIGCKACMQIGCPAISVKNGKACVDPAQCVGCDICSQLCKKGAFHRD